MVAFFLLFVLECSTVSAIADVTPSSTPSSTPAINASSMEGDFKLHLFASGDVEQFRARCIDGSPMGYYMRNPSVSTLRKKWVIYFLGGAFCDPRPNPVAQSCQERANTTQGSSTYWPESHTGDLLQSSSRDVNPFSWNWQHVFLRYCSGDLYTGVGDKYDDTFYFSGRQLIVTLIHVLQRDHGFNLATDVVITGDSAGGMATLMWTDMFSEALPNARVSGVPLAGYFLFQPRYNGTVAANAASWKDTFQPLVKIYGSQFIDACESGTSVDDRYLCITGPHASQFAKSPLLFGEMAYDTAQLFSRQGNAPKDPDHPASADTYVREFGITMEELIKNSTTRAGWGFWLASCMSHVDAMEGAFWNKSFTVSGLTLGEAVMQWYSGHKVHLSDAPLWPASNPYATCSTWAGH